MDDKIKAITEFLQAAFPEAAICHGVDFDSGRHKFRIEDPAPRLWLLVGDTTMEDHDAGELLQMLVVHDVVEVLRKAPARTRLLLEGTGLTTVA